MSNETKVQQPATGSADPHSTTDHGGSSATAAAPQNAPAGAIAPEEIRPVTLKSGVHVISGPLPNNSKGGAGNVAGTPGFGFTFHGMAGGSFSIDGAGFNQYGSVYVGDKQVTVTAWEQNRIKGLLPADVDTSQEVKVVDGTGTTQVGPTNRQEHVDRARRLAGGPSSEDRAKAGTPNNK